MKISGKESPAFWTALDVEQAISILEKEPIPPPCVEVFSTILFKCRKERAKEHTLRLHSHMLKYSLEAHSVLGNRVVATLADIGSIQEAHKIFDGLEYRNDMSWHALVSGYLKLQRPHDAVYLHGKMQNSDRINVSGRTFVALLKACLMLQDFDKGLEIHAEVARLGFLDRDLFVGSTVVDFHAKCGSIGIAKQVFDKVVNKDVVLWNTLVTGYVKHGFGHEALYSFHEMQCQGIIPNPITYICGLKACALVGSVEESLAIHTEAERKDFLKNDHVLNCTLIDTYAKFGCLGKAKDVFDAHSVHSLVSWTALISGYADHEHGQEALAAHAKMQDEGVCPNAVTYICLLKACGYLTDGKTGQALHCEVARMDLQKSDISLGNALIDMYCKCGLLAIAYEVFNKLPQVDAISWNTLLNGLTDEGLCLQALQCFEYMQQLRHITPNCVTFAIILKACAAAKSPIKGQQIHLEIQKRGLFEGEHLTGNELVYMYAMCGLLQEAQQVFSYLSLRDVFSWNALLVGFLENQDAEIVVEFFGEMQLAGVAPNAASFNCFLKACGSLGATEQGEQIHAELEKIGFSKVDSMIGNALVDMYAKCGLLASARHLFDELHAKDTITWNGLIFGYVDWGYGRKAIELFEEMQVRKVSPDLVTFVSVLKACGIVGAIEKGRGFHAEVARQGILEFDLSLGNTLVDMYAKCNLLFAAQEVFNGLPCQDTVAWNVLLAGYTDLCHGKEALKQFRKMQSMAVFADDITFITCLRACSNAGAVDEGRDIHSQIVKKGLFAMLFVNTALVDMYSKLGLLLDAHHLFLKHPFQDLYLWNVLIAGYVAQEQSEKALDCVEQMQLKGASPDVITHIYSLKACGCLGAQFMGERLHIDITKKGLLERDYTVGNALVDMYAKCGLLAVANSVFDRLPFQDICSWNALIAAYDELMDCEDVFLVFDTMLDKGMKPDAVTFILLLNACSRRGLLDRANEFLMLMSNDYGIEPISEHYTCIIDLLGRMGYLREVVTTIKELPYSSDSAVGHSFLSTCQRWGFVDFGKTDFEAGCNV